MPKVNIEVGKPVKMEQDANGPGYNIYPIRVTAEGKGVQKTTLSVNGSRVMESPTRVLNYRLSERDYKGGGIKLFASAWDGRETAKAEQALQGAPAAPSTTPPQSK